MRVTPGLVCPPCLLLLLQLLLRHTLVYSLTFARQGSHAVGEASKYTNGMRDLATCSATNHRNNTLLIQHTFSSTTADRHAQRQATTSAAGRANSPLPQTTYNTNEPPANTHSLPRKEGTRKRLTPLHYDPYIPPIHTVRTYTHIHTHIYIHTAWYCTDIHYIDHSLSKSRLIPVSVARRIQPHPST